MTSADEGIVGVGSIGSPVVLSEEKKMIFNVHDFQGLMEKKQYKTTRVACFGFPWFITIYPWGEGDEAKEKEMVSICLHKASGAAVKAEYSIKVGTTKVDDVDTFVAVDYGWGWSTFMKRSEAIEALDERGTLRIEVKLRIWSEKLPIWKPKNILQGKVEKLYKDDYGKDVTLSLSDGNLVKIHSSVLSIQCPTLYEIVSQEKAGNHVEIDNVDADLFATMIRFMYFESLHCDFKLTESGVDLLKLADRFGYTDLKVLLEGELVESNAISVKTAAEYFLLADGISCALLKEAALDIIIAKPTKVMKTKGWEELKESNELLAEVLEHIVLSKETVEDERVSNMRNRLAKAGLDVDGTKEMLVKRCRTELN